MAYPEHGAKYKNEPAWFDRAKRAEGGSVNDQRPAYLDQVMNPHSSADANDQSSSEWRDKAMNDQIMRSDTTNTGDNMSADTSSNRPSFLKGLTPK